MALFTKPEPKRTGLRRQYVQDEKGPMARQRRSLGLTRVNSPVLPQDAPRYGFRASRVDTKPPYDFKKIHQAYQVDDYVRQGVDRHVELILKEGWHFKGEEEPVEYLTQRLSLMTAMTGQPLETLIEQITRDLVEFGNVLLVRQRSSKVESIPGVALRSLSGKTPIGGYFTLPVQQATPVFAEDDSRGKRQTHWRQSVGNETKDFPVEDVIHITYCKASGALWGMPGLLSVIEDVLALRQAEESVLKLLDKHLNPIIHQEVPDTTGTGEGRQEDVDEAALLYQQMAPDGFIITPPGHKIQMLGADGKALRAKEYLSIFKLRVFAGLGVTEAIMGEGEPRGTADQLSAPMHIRAKYYQSILRTYLVNFVVNELLMEGGFDPWNTAEDRVMWEWNEIEIDRRVKEETHALFCWTSNSITRAELREKLGRRAMTEDEEADTYSATVQIPQLTAVHRLERETLDVRVDGAGGGGHKEPGGGADDGRSGKRVAVKKINRQGTGNALGNKVRPANQHGVKFSPNAPRAHKMAADSFFQRMMDACTDIREERLAPEELSAVIRSALDESTPYPQDLCLGLLEDAQQPDPAFGMLLAERRLKSWLTVMAETA